jgi:hypothetical protein
MVNLFLSGTVTNNSGTVGIVSSQIVGANPNRHSVYIVNDGSNEVYLALQGTAQRNRGVRINASGSSDSTFEINSNNLYAGTISAISSSGTVNVTILEMLTN